MSTKIIDYPKDVKLPRTCPNRPDIVATTAEEISDKFGWRKVASDPDRYAPQSWSHAARSEYAQKNAKEKREKAKAKREKAKDSPKK